MQYHPLDFSKHETRLLRLPPSSSACDVPGLVSCELLHGISLINPPRYCALSYCWGDASVTVPILINGNKVQVTKNLEAALREVRHNARICDLLWVDALCINQVDLYERSYQVMKMGLIFSSAECVIAWLGQPSNRTQAKAFLGYLRDSWTLAKISEEEKQLLSDSLRELSAFPFWYRVWIIQEISKAQTVVLQYGDSSFDWKPLVDTINTPDARSLIPLDLYTLVRVLDWFRYREKADVIGSERVSLLRALFETRNSLATDPRDKIYALLGLTSDGAGVVPLPNYEQSLKDVYMQASTNIIVEQGKIGAILLSGRQRPAENSEIQDSLPSWAPNWSATRNWTSVPWIMKCMEHIPSTRDISARIGLDGALQTPCRLHETVEAVFDTPLDPANFNSESTVLEKIDYAMLVRQIYTAITWDSHGVYNDFLLGGHSNFSKFHTKTKQIGGHRVESSITGAMLDQRDFEIFLDILLDRGEIDRNSNSFLRIRSWMQTHGSLKLGSKTHSQMLFDQMPSHVSQGLRLWPTKRPHDFKRIVRTLSWGLKELDNRAMRIAITDRRVRIVHQNTQVGDRIALLPNCPIPVVLRPYLARQMYQLVGEAYSEAFARLFHGHFGGRNDRPWPDTWEVEGIRINSDEFVTIN